MSNKSDQDPLLDAMYQRAIAQADFGKPTPTLDKAMAIASDATLSYQDKCTQLEALEREAQPHEQDGFADVWESVIVAAPLDERLAIDGEVK